MKLNRLEAPYGLSDEQLNRLETLTNYLGSIMDLTDPAAGAVAGIELESVEITMTRARLYTLIEPAFTIADELYCQMLAQDKKQGGVE